MEGKDIIFLRKLIKETALETMREFNDTRIPIYFIANRLQKDEDIIRKLFKEMLSNNEFPGEYDAERDFIVYKKPPEKCYNCGALMAEREKKCNKCGIEMRMCMLCKKLIREVPAICPNCKSAAHEHHFKDWLKMGKNKITGMGSCPKCETPLDPSDILKEDDLYKSYFTF